MIELKNIAIGYTSTLIGVNEMILRPGEIKALIGANGMGKTTFLKTLMNQIPPISGNITIDDISLHKLDRAKLSRLVSFIGHGFKGVDGLTVLEYILLGRTPYLDRFGSVSDGDKLIALEALKSAGIEYLSDRNTSELSDGQLQLASIARALAQETPYIIMDEPTTFLDYRNREIIFNLLIELTNKGKGILFSTHELDMVSKRQIPVAVISSEQKMILLDRCPEMDQLIKLCF
ncbi:MAG: ABC transporter ATP-binding protein [Bacteroidetes bacterium]|nr:MAG: ABC transporter ATP-binding protein [Bacteroidota bacterium]